MIRARTVAPLFFLSGAVALGLEAAWFRSLALSFGATHRATGTLLAAFMLGLALGSEAAGRWGARVRSPLRAYALCEAAVALYALATPVLFRAADDWLAGTGGAARVLLALALLAPPTVAMGATLPLLARAAGDAAGTRATLAVLYAANTLGGVVGALGVGFLALPRWGLTGTLHALAIGAVVVASLALAVSTRAPPRDGATPEPPVRTTADRRTSGWALGLLAGVGTVSFGLQVAYNRVFGLLLGSSSYTFSLVVAAVLLSLAAGGAAGRDASTRGPWESAARRLLLLAIFAYLGLLAVHVAPSYLMRAAESGRATALWRAALVLAVVFPPGYQTGALFPALSALAHPGDAGRAAGRGQFAATAGNVAGALGASFVALPSVGAQATMAALSLAALALGCAAATRAGRTRATGTLLAAGLAVVLGAMLYPRWDPVGLSAGSYRVALYRRGGRTRTAPCGPRRAFPQRRALYVRDGAVGTVTVLGLGGDADCALYSLRVNGKAEGSAFVAGALASRVPAGAELLNEGDLPTERMAGWLPVRAGAPPRETLVVGWGTGYSVRAMLDAGAARVTVAEIEPAVLEAARVFDATLADDPRVRVVLDDARMVLRRAAPGSLDVVVSQPSNPWVVGSSALFSVEYFELLRSRLRAGGRALAWVQLYDADADTVRALMATFVRVFPGARAYRPGSAASDLLLLGANGGEPAEVPAAHGALVFDAAQLARACAGARPNTDDAGRVEFAVADRLLAGTGEEPDRVLQEITESAR